MAVDVGWVSGSTEKDGRKRETLEGEQHHPLEKTTCPRDRALSVSWQTLGPKAMTDRQGAFHVCVEAHVSRRGVDGPRHRSGWP